VEATVKLGEMAEQLGRASPEQREQARAKIAPQMIAQMRQAQDPTSRWLLGLYDAAHGGAPTPANAGATPTKPPAPSEGGKHLWGCMAEGRYESCDRGKTYVCPSYMSPGYGYGKTRDLAASRATTECSSQMTKFIIISNMGSGARIKEPCRVINCTPPH
jgi:hypothetical protein